VARQAALDAQRRVEEERLRIARELHDVVAHTMATITVQAAAATQLLRDRPDEAAESLRAIRAASKDGLRELRAILDVLRTATGGDEAADPTQPTPGLSRLDALVAGVCAAGLPVTVAVTGTPRDLPAVTDLAAFRIIQEALTNTLRHAGPATAVVTVDYGAAALRVEVTDTGHGLAGSAAEAAYAAFVIDSGHHLSPSVAALARDPVGAAAGTVGHGLRGMRERAATAGGTIDIGPLPLPARGFRVAAALPLDPRAAGTSSGTTSATTTATQKAAR
jgi:signal transduction histidine kinase